MRILAIFFLFASQSIIAQHGKGCLPEEIDTNKVYKKKYAVSRDKTMPSSYSLYKYAPPVQDQGSLGSCTSWACAYAGFTIVNRIEQENIFATPYSPLSLHNRLKVKNGYQPCTYGNYIFDALQMLKDYGCEEYRRQNNYCKIESSSQYFDDKLNDFDIIDISTYDFKSSLSEKSPIIISMTSYNNGWNNRNNFSNGVWNGNHEKPDGTLHAMCIIGYDDYIGGGSFQVMNSWGSDWGKNGYFWLRYKDLYTITNAYQLIPNISTDDLTPDDRVDELNKQTLRTSYFRLYNECSLPSYVAITKRVNGYWTSVGWYSVKPGGYYDYYIGDRDAEQIYWIATGENNKLWWYSGESNARSFCYDPVYAFNKSDNDDCNQKINYYYFNPESNNNGITASHTITCPNYSNTRGESGQAIGEVSNLRFDNRRADTANKFWKKDFLLFDFHSNRMIQPITDDKGIASYDIWYVDNKKKVTNVICSAENLEKINHYKFTSKENAEMWLDANKNRK